MRASRGAANSLGRGLAVHDLEDRLIGIIAQSAWLSEVLRAVRGVGPAGSYVAAGAVRDTVWNFLTGRVARALGGDVDVVYFDPDEGEDNSGVFESRLAQRLPAARWEVTNQAHVHRWHRNTLGEPASPFASIGDALANWPETATAVGARLTVHGTLEVIAPLGLGDLFSMRVRHNPAHGDVSAYRARLASKGWKERWPELTIVESEKKS